MKTILTILVVILAFSPVNAEMYKWIEDDGSVTFKDTPPPKARKTKKVKVYSDSDFDAAPPIQQEPAKRGTKKVAAPAPQSSPAKAERFSGTVEIYVTDWCGYCKKALKYMDSKGIPYVSYNIENDSAARQRHKELGGRGVPLIIIGPNKLSGFSQATFEQYMNNSR